MKIVGPIRLRSIHTKSLPCLVPTDLELCFYQEMTDETMFKEKINGVNWMTCEEIGTDM